MVSVRVMVVDVPLRVAVMYTSSVKSSKNPAAVCTAINIGRSVTLAWARIREPLLTVFASSAKDAIRW